jgi:hypothetical protein
MMKPKLRRIELGRAGSAQLRREQVYASQARAIQKHPRYTTILGALREGIGIPEIARWFAERGWIDVNEKTFTEYLRTFAKRNSHLITGGDEDSIDSLVGAHDPNIDVMTELNRLYRLQKKRLKVDVTNEMNIGKLFNTTVKEMEAATDILKLMAEIEGRIGKGVKDSNFENHGGEVRDHLRKLQTDESQRDRLTYLAEELGKSLDGKETVPT